MINNKNFIIIYYFACVDEIHTLVKCNIDKPFPISLANILVKPILAMKLKFIFQNLKFFKIYNVKIFMNIIVNYLNKGFITTKQRAYNIFLIIDMSK